MHSMWYVCIYINIVLKRELESETIVNHLHRLSLLRAYLADIMIISKIFGLSREIACLAYNNYLYNLFSYVKTVWHNNISGIDYRW